MAMERTEPFKAPPLARIGYAQNLLKVQVNDTGKEFYSCTLIWPKTVDLTALKQQAGAVALKQWGDKAAQWIKDGVIKTPILDGDGPQAVNKGSGQRYPELVGAWFIRPSATKDFPPRVVNGKVLPVTAIGDEFYSGCYVNAVLNAFCWDNPKNGKGVSFGIMAVQVAKAGERIGGGSIDTGKFFETIVDDGASIVDAKKSDAGAAALFS